MLATVGWEPKFAAVGKDVKVAFNGMDPGFGGVTITDPDDRPLPDGEARLSAALPRILRVFAGGAAPAASGAAPAAATPR